MPFLVVAGELISCLNWANSTLPMIAKTLVKARKARVGCLRKILLNSWRYGARWIADHLFDSMSESRGRSSCRSSRELATQVWRQQLMPVLLRSCHNSRSNVSNRHSRISGKNKAPWHLGFPIHKGALFLFLHVKVRFVITKTLLATDWEQP